MKKLMLSVLLLAFCQLANAQDPMENVYVKYPFFQQSNPNILITMYARKRVSSTGQQLFSLQLKNLTTQKIRVTGTYYASLTCGNQKIAKVDISLAPGETKGDNSFAMDGNNLTASVDAADCAGNGVIENGIKVATTRIVSVGCDVSVLKPSDVIASTGVESAKPIKEITSPAVAPKPVVPEVVAPTKTTPTPVKTVVQSPPAKNAPIVAKAAVTPNTSAGVKPLPKTEETKPAQSSATKPKAVESVRQFFGGIGGALNSANKSVFGKAKDGVDFANSDKQVKELDYKLTTEGDKALQEKDFKTAIERFYTSSFLTAQQKYNEINLYNLNAAKKYAEDKPLSADYFPKVTNKTLTYTKLELPEKLPDLYYVPLCHCNTSVIYKRSYDDAFILLRELAKCKTIMYGGQAYEVLADKMKADKIDAKAALVALNAVVQRERPNNTYDFIDYVNSYVWIAYLENKNAQTIGDLQNGLAKLLKFYQGIEGFVPLVKRLGSNDNEYLSASYAMINYFISSYYYRIATSSENNPELQQMIAENLKELHGKSVGISMSLSKQYTDVNSKEIAVEFAKPKYLLKE